jgi:hypothetical protein
MGEKCQDGGVIYNGVKMKPLKRNFNLTEYLFKQGVHVDQDKFPFQEIEYHG